MFYNAIFVLLTNLFCVLESYWHFEMLTNLDIFITTVKAFKKNSVCKFVCV